MHSRSGTSQTSLTELLHLTSVPAATAFVDGGRRRDDESERVSAAHRVRFRYPHHPRARGRVEAADPAERSLERPSSSETDPRFPCRPTRSSSPMMAAAPPMWASAEWASR